MLLLVATVLIVVTAVPYLYGYVTTPEHRAYTGLHHLTPGDTNVFLSMIEQTKQGDNVFINPYTSEAQARIFINPLWLSVGYLAKIFQLSNLLALHVARSIWIVIFVLVAYCFIAYLFKEKKYRYVILLMIVFSSGLGVFFNPFLFDVNNLYEQPIDMWVPESITFLTLYHTPHLIASLTLIILIFLLMLMAFEKNRLSYSIAAGFCSMLVIWFHPFHGPTIFGVIGVYIVALCIKQRRIIWPYIKHYVVLGWLTVPSVLYLFLIHQASWVIRQWNAQNNLPSPSVWMYLIGYGFLIPLAIAGVWAWRRKFKQRHIFLMVWVVVTGILLYFPVDFQRRMVEGLHIPLSILAGVGAIFLYRKVAHSRLAKIRFALPAFLLVFLPLSNIQMVGQDIYLYATKKGFSYYITTDEIQAMGWIKENVTGRQVIFSSFPSGNFIPAYSGRVVWIGHGPQTIDLPEKREVVDWFWRDNSDDQARYRFLLDEGIDFVYYGPLEKSQDDYNPETKSYLEKVFTSQQVLIFKVVNEAAGQ